MSWNVSRPKFSKIYRIWLVFHWKIILWSPWRAINFQVSSNWRHWIWWRLRLMIFHLFKPKIMFVSISNPVHFKIRGLGIRDLFDRPGTSHETVQWPLFGINSTISTIFIQYWNICGWTETNSLMFLIWVTFRHWKALVLVRIRLNISKRRHFSIWLNLWKSTWVILTSW